MKPCIRIPIGLVVVCLFLYLQDVNSQNVQDALVSVADTAKHQNTDTIPSVSFRDVNITYFKTDEERMMYYKYKSRIQKVMPYVKIAKQLYVELKDEKQNSKKREYKHYRKDVEKEMRQKFEKELKDLTIGQGEMLFKLINRETQNNGQDV